MGYYDSVRAEFKITEMRGFISYVFTKIDTMLTLLCVKVSLEKEMATPSSILAWRIPWIEEPGELQSIGLVAKSRTWMEAAL